MSLKLFNSHHWAFLPVLIFGFASLAKLELLNLPIALTLAMLSSSRHTFWSIVIPSLIVFSGLEKTVFLDRSAYFVTPINSDFLPDLWLVVFAIRILSYWISERKIRIIPEFALFSAFFLALLFFSSIAFTIEHGGLGGVNKAPIKLVIFVFCCGVIISEIRRFNIYSAVVCAVAYAAVAGAILRLGVIYWYATKDPGIYTYTGVFISAYFLSRSSKMNDFSRKGNLAVGFWIVILLLHASASRTELALFSLSLFLFFFRPSKSVLFPAFLLVSCVIVVLSYLPVDFVNFYMHKASFFMNLLNDNVGIGDSASVRLSTFFNLVDGSQTSFFNIAFGRGFVGYTDFAAYPNFAIYSESAFSDSEHSSGMYFHLHFFLNSLLFYFGVFGVLFFFLAVFFLFKISFAPSSVVLIAYFIFNSMFRLELIVIVPALMWSLYKLDGKGLVSR
jgi:hypothetical protein